MIHRVDFEFKYATLKVGDPLPPIGVSLSLV